MTAYTPIDYAAARQRLQSDPEIGMGNFLWKALDAPRSEATLMTRHPTRTERSLVLASSNIALKLTNARTASTVRIAPALRARSLTRAFGPLRG